MLVREDEEDVNKEFFTSEIEKVEDFMELMRARINLVQLYESRYFDYLRLATTLLYL
jgi:hypothetical protein